MIPLRINLQFAWRRPVGFRGQNFVEDRLDPLPQVVRNFPDGRERLGLGCPFPSFGMVQKRPFSGNTRALSADPDRSRVGAGLRESLVAVLGLQVRENRVYPRSSSQ